MNSRILGAAISACLGFVLVVILLWPQPIEGTPVGSILAKWLAGVLDPQGTHRTSTYRVMEEALNVAIFVPFAFAIYQSCSRRKFAFSLLIPICISAIGEICQLLFLPYRVASFQDVCLNSAGALFGTLIAWGVNRLGNRGRKLP